MKHCRSEQFTSTLPTITSLQFIPGLQVKVCGHYTGNFLNSCSITYVSIQETITSLQFILGLQVKVCEHYTGNFRNSSSIMYVSIQKTKLSRTGRGGL
jgi:hypothetical protein